MPTTPHVTLPLTDPLALLDATALFVIQLLLARHPHLLDAPEETSRPPPLLHALLLLDRVRDLQYAIELYRSRLDHETATGHEDDIPF